MVSTRNSILGIADHFIMAKGYNAFSFKDISNSIGIKTASIHYHFPTKSDLGVAVIKSHINHLEDLKREMEGKSPTDKLKGFLSIYENIKAENKVCLVGSLATDFNTVDRKIQKELRHFADLFLNWVTEILQEGKEKKELDFRGPARTKALMLITNMLAIVQLSRLTSPNDFETVKETILKDLKPTKK